jgi:Carboxysome Shell Carbonic Anhydrase.
MAHVIRYVLRLPAELVRRKAYAGAVFDIEDNLAKWAEVELMRTQESGPSATQYLKVVAYHVSSVDCETEGCAAHGSDDQKAAQAGLDALDGFKKAVAQTFHQDQAVEGLLIGVDTATDAIRLSPARCKRCDRAGIHRSVLWTALAWIALRFRRMLRYRPSPQPPGMQKLAARFDRAHLEKLPTSKSRHAGAYSEIGHASDSLVSGRFMKSTCGI